MLPMQRPHHQRTAHHGHGNKEVIAAAIDHACQDITSILIKAKQVGQ